MDHGQRGGEHESLSLRVELGRAEHLQQVFKFSKMTLFNHAVSFINDQTPEDIVLYTLYSFKMWVFFMPHSVHNHLT